ncbi:MAG TPA: S53 family peptidase [Candidatus Saccharimonadia bacterium]
MSQRFGLSLVISCVMLGLTALPVPVVQAAGTSACTVSQSASSRACFARLVSSHATSSPAGLTPAQLRSAYGATGQGNAHLAIVDAYGDRSLGADLAAYAKAFRGTPPVACSRPGQTACYEQLNQRGGQTLPAANSGWAEETALDAEVAWGVCPGCRITVVAADSASTSNLLAAIDQAVGLGAQIVSLSWGGPESKSETTWDKHLAANVSFIASSGDDGYGVSWPASSPRVTAVGGTTLKLTSTGARLSETAWSGAGSGCSAYEAKPAWQHDAGCTHRTVADVAAVADPATGAAVYSSAAGGWLQVGGTSLAAPVVAALTALASPAIGAGLPNRIYSAPAAAWHDIVSGRTGTCSPSYLCTAGNGYDAPTGNGTPAGPSAL